MKRSSTRNALFSWGNRARDLARVKRYHTYEVMYYRTNLEVHSRRVEEIVKALSPAIQRVYPTLDAKKARLISRFHDDCELVNGDVSLQLKLQMGTSEHATFLRGDIEAAELLNSSYRKPKIEGYRYLDLLMEAILKDSPEAQLHSFADKLDGFCEAFHEVLAGNYLFLQPVLLYILKTFNDLPGRFPLIKEAFNVDDSCFSFPVVDLRPYLNACILGDLLHTPSSVERKMYFPQYELWRKITLAMPGGVDLLTKQIESH